MDVRTMVNYNFSNIADYSAFLGNYSESYVGLSRDGRFMLDLSSTSLTNGILRALGQWDFKCVRILNISNNPDVTSQGYDYLVYHLAPERYGNRRRYNITIFTFVVNGTQVPPSRTNSMQAYFRGLNHSLPAECHNLPPLNTLTISPSVTPSIQPSLSPSIAPSYQPSVLPSQYPSFSPSHIPSLHPSASDHLSFSPSFSPTAILHTATSSLAPIATVINTASTVLITTLAPVFDTTPRIEQSSAPSIGQVIPPSPPSSMEASSISPVVTSSNLLTQASASLTSTLAATLDFAVRNISNIANMTRGIDPSGDATYGNEDSEDQITMSKNELIYSILGVVALGTAIVVMFRLYQKRSRSTVLDPQQNRENQGVVMFVNELYDQGENDPQYEEINDSNRYLQPANANSLSEGYLVPVESSLPHYEEPHNADHQYGHAANGLDIQYERATAGLDHQYDRVGDAAAYPVPVAGNGYEYSAALQQGASTYNKFNDIVAQKSCA